jgi:Na+/melibiose symporter-like transporter
MEWRTPATADNFEHDVSASHLSAWVLLAVVAVLTIVLVVWTPEGVVVPGWLVLMILLLILFFPLRWALRRPWTVVAATGDDGEGEPTEQWVGTVRGVFTVRQEIADVARNIVNHSAPGIEGPLTPVN